MMERLRKANLMNDPHRWRRTKMAPSGLPASALTRIHDWGNDALWALAGVSALLFLYGSVYAVPNARLMAAQQMQDAIEFESRAFCEKHGMPIGTREYASCAADLVGIRATEHQRTLDGLGTF